LAKKHDASLAAYTKTSRRQFDEKYDVKKVRNNKPGPGQGALTEMTWSALL
jgi:hypothetical protein